MPVLKRFEAKKYLEDYEEINEHSPLFETVSLDEGFSLSQGEVSKKISFWKRWWMSLKQLFLKI